MKHREKNIVTAAIAAAMLISVPLIGMDKIILTVFGWAYAIVTVLMLTRTAGIGVSCVLEKAFKHDRSQLIRPIVSAVIAVGSLIAGLISYHTDHSFMLRGMEAELIWVLITIPAFILSVVQFIKYFVKNYTIKKKET